MNPQKHAKLLVLSSTFYTVAVQIIQSRCVRIMFSEGHFGNKIRRASTQ